jgi:UDP-N-acetylglucosamine/UDP-N-acetyl-alpha-D-glucosaminouronate 4-epimerase
MRFVVTGGAGFIGSHLVGHLVTTGHEVVVLDNLLTGHIENISSWLNSIELVEGSITNLRTCAKAFKGADFVLHQAALPSVPRSVRDPVETHEANVTGTLNVLLAAYDAGVNRVVYAASSSAYGNTAVLPKHEHMTPQPLSPYAASKLAGEAYLQVFHDTYGLETVALRYFNVFGPRQDPMSQYSAAIPRFISAALSGNPPIIYGNGEQTRDFTYVTNVVHANMLACKAPPEALGQVFNVGCGERVSVNRLWKRIRDLTGGTVEAEHCPERAGEVRDSVASLEKIQRVLGYEPLVGLDEGLRFTVDFFSTVYAAHADMHAVQTQTPTVPELFAGSELAKGAAVPAEYSSAMAS